MVVGGVRGCGGHVWLWGTCVVAGRGAWLLGACMVAGGVVVGGMHGCQGACVVAGGCIVAGGACVVAGGHAWLPGGMHGRREGGMRRIRRDRVNQGAVRILLECILVLKYISTGFSPKIKGILLRLFCRIRGQNILHIGGFGAYFLLAPIFFILLRFSPKIKGKI